MNINSANDLPVQLLVANSLSETAIQPSIQNDITDSIAFNILKPNSLRMTAIILFNVKLAILSMITIVVILLPEAMKWKMVALANEKSPPLLEALQSYEFQISLVVSLSLSAPMFFELLLRICLHGKLDFVLPNLLTLATLALPDLINLCYVRISLDLISLNLIIQARFILFSSLAFAFINRYGGKRWSSKSLSALFTIVCVGRILGVYKAYVHNILYDVLNIFGIISNSTVCLFFPIMSFNWYYYLFQQKSSVPISTDQYLCNIYVTAYLLTCCGIAMILYILPGSSDLMMWNSTELTLHTLMYTVFYIIVIVFESRALQREMLQAKVR